MLDDALVPAVGGVLRSVPEVSILVVLDDALVLMKITVKNGGALARLNPCCAGRCPSTRKTETILIINMLQNYAKVIFAFLNQKLTIS